MELEVRDYVKGGTSALQFIKNIEQRKQTILRFANQLFFARKNSGQRN
jgi:hypothetical protein